MRKRHVLWVLGAAVLALLAWRTVGLVLGGPGAGGRPERPPVAVETDSVRFEPIQESRQLTGTVYPLYHYIVAPKVAGRVVRIRQRIGDWVERGEEVARIDDAEYEQQLLEAEASLRVAQASLTESQSQFALARQELARVQSLQEKGIASPAELDAATTNHEALQSRIQLAQAQVEQRQAALNMARIRLEYTVLRATEPGFIGERFTDEGSLLAPNSPVVSVIGIDTVIVRATVVERVYGQVRTGQPAQVEVDAFPGRRFHGHVSRVAPMLQEASRVAQLEVEVANDSLLLKPGMFSRVRLVLAEKERAQVVPSRSLVSRNEAHGLFVVPPGQSVARYVPVQPGITTPERVEIVQPA
ncbi:MAG: efflux RND transporter periplasmic adaptor subunit, partial [Candidatus Latescibacterota bacterium]